jgi:hypothetical protein
VLDGSASRKNGRFGAVRRMRVYHGAKSHRFGLAAGGIDLVHGHGHLSAIADAGGSEQLHHVGAVGLHLVHVFADAPGIARVFVDRTQGSDQTRTRDGPRLDLLAQIAIQFGADALHRGESAHEDRIKIGGGI